MIELSGVRSSWDQAVGLAHLLQRALGQLAGPGVLEREGQLLGHGLSQELIVLAPAAVLVGGLELEDTQDLLLRLDGDAQHAPVAGGARNGEIHL